MAFALGPKALAHNYRLSAYDAIGSTNSEALDRGRGGDPGRLWVVARSQTAGHGRRGRPWETPTGNLAASLLLSLPGRNTQAATLGFAAGLALEGAIRQCAPGILLKLALDEGREARDRVTLKWPNDVLIDSAKVAGILLEAATVHGERSIVVIGIGVNVLHKPMGTPYPATSLGECGAETTPEALFTALAESWVEQEELWSGGRGFAMIRDRWLDRAAGLGAPIAVRTGEAIFRGTFETIDDEGRLVVRATDGSTTTFSAGEVHFGAVATVTQ